MPVDDSLQHLSRAAGLSAYLVLWIDVCLGVAMTGWQNLPLLPRWRVADLHQFTGLLAIGLLATHIAVLVGLETDAFTVPELLVPLVRQPNPLAPLLGITGLYICVLVLAISHARRFVGLRIWRLVHTFSFAAFGLALAHAVAAGPDASEVWVRALYVSTVAIVMVLIARRLRCGPRSSSAARVRIAAAPEETSQV